MGVILHPPEAPGGFFLIAFASAYFGTKWEDFRKLPNYEIDKVFGKFYGCLGRFNSQALIPSRSRAGSWPSSDPERNEYSTTTELGRLASFELIQLLADRYGMSAGMPEFRAVVMTVVEASWQDSSGALQTTRARMEDKSPGGACVRVKTPIAVGSKLRIQWRFEQFSGTVRYCRSEGREYLVGIRRDTAKGPDSSRPAPTDVAPHKSVNINGPLISAGKSQSLAQPQPTQPNEIRTAPQKIESPSIVRSITVSARAMVHETGGPDSRRLPRLQDFDAVRPTQFSAKQPPKESCKERKSMRSKWLELAPWRKKRDVISVSGDRKPTDKSEKENLMPHLTQPTETSSAHSAREVPTFQVELLSMEDIYGAAGIRNPRRGYSINKVVEMLHSQHIRDLSMR